MAFALSRQINMQKVCENS